MKVIISGTNGFLGGQLARHFVTRGDSVVPLQLRPDTSDIFLTEVISREQPDVIINAGSSQVTKDDARCIDELVLSNVLIPARISSLIKGYSPATYLINFGTSWQIDEYGSSVPFNAYAASKSAVEPFLQHFAQDGARIATLRLYDTYGPLDTRRKIVNLIADALMSGTNLPMSPGGQAIDLIHVDDVVAAVDCTIEFLRRQTSGVHAIFAVRSGSPTTVLHLLDMMTHLSGRSSEKISPGSFPYRPRERLSLFADTITPPGWYPRISLESGLAEVLEARRHGLVNPSV